MHGSAAGFSPRKFSPQDERLQVVKDLTLHYWPLVRQSGRPADVFKEFCQALEHSGAISLDVSGGISAVTKPSIFISNHLTVIEPLKVLIDHTYSLPYHSLLLDYAVEKYTGRPVSHISANPQKISPLLQVAAERLGYLLVERDMSPRGWTVLSRRVAETLSEGRHISVAPEGHFHAWDGVGPFKRGVYHWARENSAEVIPVKLSGFETLGPRLEIRFAAPETASPSISAADFVADIRERVFGKQFGLRLL
jgi:hypothetical protein